MSNEDETFEQNDAGASQTIPTPCSDIKKGGYAMLKGLPCKVSFTENKIQHNY